MNRAVLVFLLMVSVLSVHRSHAQSFRKLSRPEKCWVLFHPLKARKAAQVTKDVQVVVDSIRRNGIVGADNLGGKLDAFKHAYWMASLASEIGTRRALKLGNAHEKGNYLQFRRRSLEDAALPDSVSSEMDLRNNQFGISVVKESGKMPSHTLQKKILDGIVSGKLTVIKKDEEGNCLTCEGVLISQKQWTGKWGIPKCLVPTFSH